jgi:hypothetical protein
LQSGSNAWRQLCLSSPGNNSLRYNGGMDDNPYKSPQHVDPAEIQAIAPVWRRRISPLLIIFGVFGYCVATDYFRAAFLGASSPWDVYRAWLFFLIPAGMVIAGVLLRRRPRG